MLLVWGGSGLMSQHVDQPGLSAPEIRLIQVAFARLRKRAHVRCNRCLNGAQVQTDYVLWSGLTHCVTLRFRLRGSARAWDGAMPVQRAHQAKQPAILLPIHLLTV